MRKHSLLKTMLLLCALMVGTITSWAQSYATVLSLDCATPASTGTTSTSLTQENIAEFLNSAAGLSSAENKITCSAKGGDVYSGKGSGGGDIPQKCLKVGKASGGGSFTFTIPDNYDKIERVVITGYGWKTTSSISINSLTAQSPTTAQSETTFTFDLATPTRTIALNVTTSAVCITSIELYKSADTRTPIATIGDLSPVEIPIEEEGNFTLSVTPAATNAAYTISYESSDDEVLLIDEDEYLAITKGTVTVTATVTPTDLITYKPVIRDFTVNIYDPNAGDGSEARPFSVAEALVFIEGVKYESGKNYYVKGKVSQRNNSVSSGTLTYNISDDGTTTSELRVYKGKYLGDTDFTSDDQIKVNDDVIIVGPLLYYNSTTPEINTGNHIVSLNGKKLAGISYATTAYNSLPGVEFPTPTLTNPNSLTVTYSSNNTAVATVDAETGVVTLGTAEGMATITASFTGNDSFLPATASYTITTARADANISFSEIFVTITQGDEFTAPTFINPNNLTGIEFTSSYNGVASVSDAGVITLGGSTGYAVIKATYAGSVQYNAGEAICKITVDPAGVTPEPSAGGYYEKVTEVTEVTDGQYLIVNEVSNIAMSNAIDQANNYISIVISDDKIVISEDTEGAEFTITKSGEVFFIRGTNNKYIGRTESSNGLNTSDEPLNNTITFNEGKAIIQGTQGGKLQVNGGTRFRYYTSSQSPVYLYKKVAASNPDNIDIYVSAAGMATYVSNYDLDYSSVDGLKAYIAKEDGNKIVYVQVNKVPAGEGVLLRATDGGGKNYAVPTASETDDMTDNKFVRGNDAAVASIAEGGKYNYILNVVNNQIGFYRAAGNTVATNRAYLQTSINAGNGNGARILIEFDEEGNTTGVADINRETITNNGSFYNLNGQRVAQPTKGLYIVNGRKFVVK